MTARELPVAPPHKSMRYGAASLPRIAIALGDPAGIGPELALKAALDPHVRSICAPVLFGDRRVLLAHAQACGIPVEISCIARATDIDERAGVFLVNQDQFTKEPLRLGELAASHGASALDSARAAIEAALRGEVEAVVAAPQTESAIKLTGVEFDGYPSFVARCTETPPEDAFLMLCFERDGKEMRIVHTTLHVSLRRVAELITPRRIERVIRATDAALRRFGISAPRIAVAGLNPHAGEHGLFGDDEAIAIAPGMAAARSGRLVVDGPFGADTLFQQPGYDAYVVMYHDQGHIAAKTMARHRTAGLTIGTPVLFSSVAHGSALDIAGSNRGDASAMIEAIRRLVGASASETRNAMSLSIEEAPRPHY